MPQSSVLNNLSTASLAVWSVIARVPASRYRYIIYIAQACLFAWLLALLIWHFMPVPQVESLPSPQIVASSAVQAKPTKQINLKQMQNWHLFGEAKKVIAKPNPQPVANNKPVNDDAKETKLALKLLGVMASNIPERGQAIIQYQSKSDTFRVGDKLPIGNAIKLSKVLPDRAIIDNKGKYEALFLYDEKGKRIRAEQTKVVKPAGKVLDYRSDSQRSKVLADYRKRLIEDPMSMADTMQITLAKNPQGQLLGYRVSPGSDAKSFRMFGLEPGDIVTEINGIALNDPSQVMQIYQNLNNTTEASFVINRGGSTVNIMVGIQ